MGIITRRIRHLNVYANVASWIALSQAQKLKHQQIGIPASKIHVVPHFHEPKDPPSPSCPRGNILFLGRLSPEKGVDHLLRAWKLVSHQGRRLVIAGEGPESNALRALSEALQLENVDFVGFLDRARQRAIWAETSFSVIPSIWSEPFPLTFLESWGQGRCFVANRLGAMAEVVRENVDGLLADPFSPESLAKQIQQLINEPERCAKMGLSGYQRIQSEFNRPRWLAQINQVFKTTLKLVES
jgi:glycosyltransferase involved in cell wall biosynthesis